MDGRRFIASLFKDDLPAPALRLPHPVLSHRAVWRSAEVIECDGLVIVGSDPLKLLCSTLAARGVDVAVQVWSPGREPIVFIGSVAAVAAQPGLAA